MFLLSFDHFPPFVFAIYYVTFMCVPNHSLIPCELQCVCVCARVCACRSNMPPASNLCTDSVKQAEIFALREDKDQLAASTECCVCLESTRY